MNERIRKLFEENTAPSFGHELQYPRNEKGEYINPVLEDHWQTFQEGFELAVKECVEVCKSRVGNSDYNTGRMHCASDLKDHFGVEE